MKSPPNPASRSTAVPAFLALSCVGLFVAAPAGAAPAPGSDTADASVEAVGEDDQPPTIVVTGDRPEAELESPRATQPLRDTPQTVTVISDQVLRRQNLLTLRDALATIPGITFGAGEGGGGYGDSINLRGFSGSNDITQDGVRDSAQYSRTDPFNLQQIEVYNGSNSVFNGSGSIGGTINLVSKLPQAQDLTILSAAVGTDNYFRGTVDTNQRLTDTIAVRLNAMAHRNDVPGRDFESYERWGIAPSITFGIGGRTSLTLAYLHQQDDNTPIYGVPYFRSQINDGPLPGADDSDYFGFRNLDRQDIQIDRITGILAHEFSDGIKLRNLTRWQRVSQSSQTTAPQGIFCLSGTGRQPVAANATATQGLACPANLQPGQFQRSSAGPIGLRRDQENRLFINQADLRIESGSAGGIRNILVIGGSTSWEEYGLESGSLTRNADGSAAVQPIDTITNPNGLYAGPVNYTLTSRAESELDNQAVYIFDTLELTDWLELNAAARLEWNEATFQALPLATYPPGTAPLTPADLAPRTSNEQLFSYRAGIVVKPARNVSIYAAYANSETPSIATVRLGCTSGSGATLVDFCDVAPEQARIFEAGVKADIIERRLQLTASIFRNERTNYRVPSNEPGVPDPQVLDGKARVDGFAVGLTGTLAEGWQIFANYTYLDAQVLQSVSDFCRANPGSTGCGNSAALPDPQAGDRLIQTPDHAASLFTSYRFPFGLELGYGFTYQGRFALNQRNLANQTQYYSDDFLTHRLFVAYEFGNGLTAQLNIQNVTDEDYYVAIRNNVNATSGAITGGWATPGEGRSAVLSLFYSF
jgi:catecholate siderophore receptor